MNYELKVIVIKMEELTEKLKTIEGVSRVEFWRKRRLPIRGASKATFVPAVQFDLECNVSHSDIMGTAKALGFEMPERPEVDKHFFHPLNPGAAISFASPNQERRIKIGESTHFAIVSRETLKDKTRKDILNLLRTLLRTSAH